MRRNMLGIALEGDPELAFLEGQSAAMRGRSEYNPYPDGSDLALSWDRGYEVANPIAGREIYVARDQLNRPYGRF